MEAYTQDYSSVSNKELCILFHF